jgi:predicted O-methyltransferase YrrM
MSTIKTTHLHPQLWFSIQTIGTQIPPYLPTYDFSEPFIDKAHQAIANAPLKDGCLIQINNGSWFKKQPIPGWIRREDALKIYELAFFSNGDILELGSFHGLSTTIIAQACSNSSIHKNFESIDLDPSCTAATQVNLKRLGLSRYVTTRTANAITAVQDYMKINKRFAFIFVDHAHAYEPVCEVCRNLAAIIEPGGFCLFHDFNDIRNGDPTDQGHKVYQAVQECMDLSQITLYGIYGCCGLYRRELN